jgi:hypothetical protein
VVDCEVRLRLPDLVFTLGGVEVSITWFDYRVKDFNTIATSKKDSHTINKILIPYDV